MLHPRWALQLEPRGSRLTHGPWLWGTEQVEGSESFSDTGSAANLTLKGTVGTPERLASASLEGSCCGTELTPSLGQRAKEAQRKPERTETQTWVPQAGLSKKHRNVPVAPPGHGSFNPFLSKRNNKHDLHPPLSTAPEHHSGGPLRRTVIGAAGRGGEVASPATV